MKRLFILTLAMLSLSAWAQRDMTYPFRVSTVPSSFIEEGKCYVLQNADNLKFLSTNGGLVDRVDVNGSSELWRFEHNGDRYWNILTATREYADSYWKYVDYGSKTWDGIPYDGYDWYNYAGFNGEFGSVADAQDVLFERVLTIVRLKLSELIGGKSYYLDCQPPNVAFSPWKERINWRLFEAIPESEDNMMTIVNKDGTKTTNRGYDIVFNDNGDGTYSWGYADDTQQHWLGDIANVQEIRPAYVLPYNAVLVRDSDDTSGSGVVPIADSDKPVNFFIGRSRNLAPISGMDWVDWSSSDESVATIAVDDAIGVVSPTGKSGTTVISAADEVGNVLTYQLMVADVFSGKEVLVNDQNWSVGGETVDYSEAGTIWLYVGDKDTGRAFTGFSGLTWTSSNSRVATVEALPNGDGYLDYLRAKVTVEGPGTTYITATDEAGNEIKYQLSVVNRHTFPANAVLVEADNYDVGSATVNIANKQTVTLYIGNRSNGEPYTPFSWATWSVSNPEVASIVSTNTSYDNHITLKLLDDGETTITASNEDGRNKISFSLTVKRN